MNTYDIEIFYYDKEQNSQVTISYSVDYVSIEPALLNASYKTIELESALHEIIEVRIEFRYGV